MFDQLSRGRMAYDVCVERATRAAWLRILNVRLQVLRKSVYHVGFSSCHGVLPYEEVKLDVSVLALCETELKGLAKVSNRCIEPLVGEIASIGGRRVDADDGADVAGLVYHVRSLSCAVRDVRVAFLRGVLPDSVWPAFLELDSWFKFLHGCVSCHHLFMTGSEISDLSQSDPSNPVEATASTKGSSVSKTGGWTSEDGDPSELDYSEEDISEPGE